MAEFPKDPPRDRDRSVSSHAGVDSRSASYLLENHKSARLENVVINEVGRRAKRKGTRAIGGITAVPGGMGSYLDPQFNDNLGAIWGSDFYRTSGAQVWSKSASSASMVSGLLHQFIQTLNEGSTALAWATCEKVTNTSEGINGRSRLTIWDVANNVATQASLAPNVIATFQQRIFYAEDELVGWSEIGQLASYSDSNNLQVEPGIGGPVRAILPSRDSEPLLWIFKERAIFMFEVRWGADGDYLATAGDALDTTRSRIRPLTLGTGCVATKSCIWVPGNEGADVLFLSADGVRTLSRAQNDVQQGASFPISYNIPGWIDRINWNAAHRAVAAVYDNAYHLAIPMDGSEDNNFVLRYDIDAQAWSLHTLKMRDLLQNNLNDTDRLWGQNAFGTADTSATESPTDAPHQVYQLFNSTYDPSTSATVPLVAQYIEESKEYVLGDPFIKKSWDHFSFTYSSADTSYISLGYKGDQADWVTLTEVYLPGTSGTIVLGEDQLAWPDQDSITRKKMISFDGISPKYGMQVRMADVSGATEIGRITVLMSEIKGRKMTEGVRNDD